MLLVLSQTRFRHRLTRVIVLPIGLLLLLSGVSIWQITRLLSALRWVDHTNQVISQANYTQKLLLDMETGFRGYLLTGEQSFLEPYEEAKRAIDSNLDQLKTLVSDNPDQVQRVDELSTETQQWRQQVLPAIGRRQGGETEPLSELERRKQRMDQMRQQIARFIDAEEQLRNQRSQMVQQTTRSVILTSLLLALGVGAVLAYFLRRQILQVSQNYEDALHTAQIRTQETQRSAVALQHELMERQQAEAALREQEQLFRSTFNQAAVGIGHVSPGGEWLRVNQKLCEIVGYPCRELLQQTFQIITYPDDLDIDLAYVQQMLAGEISTYSIEKRYVRKDKSLVWINLTVSLVREASGQPKYFISVVEDISERKRAEVALQESLKDLADFKFALDQSSIVAITDAQGTINYVNDKFCQISQYTQEELIGQNHRIINSGYHPRSFFRQMWTTITKGQVWQGEIRNRAKDGSTYWVATTIVPFLNASGEPYQYMAIRSDITARKVAEAELLQLNITLEQRVAERTIQFQEANQELEAFTYSVSHDLRAPLRTMQGFAKALLEDCGNQLDTLCTSYIDSIIDDAAQMDRLISDLLSYSRLTHTQIHVQPTSLNDVVEEALRQLTAQIQDKQAQVRVAASLPHVMAHRSTLIQVITNLIGNAIKFVEPDTQPEIDIFVTSERQDNQDWIRLWIVDNGIGIAPEYQERVFRVFERLHGAESYPGTGIGLAIVRKGLDRMGGRAGVESQLGQGSRFWIALPRAVLATQ